MRKGELNIDIAFLFSAFGVQNNVPKSAVNDATFHQGSGCFLPTARSPRQDLSQLFLSFFCKQKSRGREMGATESKEDQKLHEIWSVVEEESDEEDKSRSRNRTKSSTSKPSAAAAATNDARRDLKAATSSKREAHLQEGASQKVQREPSTDSPFPGVRLHTETENLPVESKIDEPSAASSSVTSPVADPRAQQVQGNPQQQSFCFLAGQRELGVSNHPPLLLVSSLWSLSLSLAFLSGLSLVSLSRLQCRHQRTPLRTRFVVWFPLPSVELSMMFFRITTG